MRRKSGWLVMLLKLLRVVWPSPWTFLGLLIGGLGLLAGSKVRWRPPVVEFHDGLVAWLLERVPRVDFALALTLGHVVFGRTVAALDITREHELVHVRQYEHWGPFFVPAYLLCSLVLSLTGRDGYRDNPFEREAYGHAR